MKQLDACIVRITNAEGETRGTGFLVSTDGLIVTCAHVAEGAEPCVAFSGGEPRPVQVVSTDEAHDVAILRVEGKLPDDAEPARLGRSAEGYYTNFRSRGYRPLGEMQGIPAEGRVLHAVSECPGAHHMPLILKSQDIRKGMSGAPVYIPTLDLVAGMITGYWDGLKGDRDTAFATPAEAITALCPDIPRVSVGDGIRFAYVLRTYMERAGRTPDQLAWLSGVPRSTVLSWLQGVVRKPRSWRDLTRLARVLYLNEAETSDLLQSAGHPSLAALSALASDDQDVALLAPWAEPIRMRLKQPPFQLVRDIPHFVGREKMLEELKTALLEGQHVTIYSLEGMGGVGKTALAVHAAYQVRSSFPDGVLWARLDTSDPVSILASFAEAYGHDASAYEGLEDLSRVVRDILSRKRALIVLDNARSTEEVIPLLPPTGGCAVIVTTRHRDLSILRGARRFEIGPFDREKQEALALFSRVLGEGQCQANVMALSELADLLGHLPLAIDIAASRLAHEPMLSVSGLLRQLKEEKSRLDCLSYENLSVRVSFNVSQNALARREQELLAKLSVLPDADFSLEAAVYVAGTSYEDTLDSMRRLFALSLVQQGSMDLYRLHPLLRSYAAERAAALGLVPQKTFFTLRMDAAIGSMINAIRDGNLVLYDVIVYDMTQGLLQETTNPKLRAAILLLRHSASVILSELFRPLLDSQSFRIGIQSGLREVGRGLYSEDLVPTFEAIGKLLALPYISSPKREDKPVDTAASDHKVASGLREASLSISGQEPHASLMYLQALLQDFDVLYTARESPIPMLVLSWAKLLASSTVDTFIRVRPVLWATRDEQTALLMLEMAEAFERRQMLRIVELISRSFIPNRFVPAALVRRRLRSYTSRISREAMTGAEDR